MAAGSTSAADVRHAQALLKTDALQSAIFNGANFSSIATDARGVIQIFNVGAERMLGYAAADVVNKVTPADLSDPQELIARAEALSYERGVNVYVVKPVKFSDFVEAVQQVGGFCAVVNEVPPAGARPPVSKR